VSATEHHDISNLICASNTIMMDGVPLPVLIARLLLTLIGWKHMTKQLILFPVLRVVLLLVEHTAQYDWLLYVRFVPHREHRAVFAELRSALLLFEQAAKYYSLLLCNTMNLLYPTQKKKKD